MYKLSSDEEDEDKEDEKINAILHLKYGIDVTKVSDEERIKLWCNYEYANRMLQTNLKNTFYTAMIEALEKTGIIKSS